MDDYNTRLETNIPLKHLESSYFEKLRNKDIIQKNTVRDSKEQPNIFLIQVIIEILEIFQIKRLYILLYVSIM